MARDKVTVAVMDGRGLNCIIQGVNALEIAQHIMHSVGRNYILIDYTYDGTPKSEREHAQDYIMFLR